MFDQLSGILVGKVISGSKELGFVHSLTNLNTQSPLLTSDLHDSHKIFFNSRYYKPPLIVFLGLLNRDFLNCKTQNSGLRSKEEKSRDPINEPSRCNAQEGLLSVAQTG